MAPFWLILPLDAPQPTLSLLTKKTDITNCNWHYTFATKRKKSVWLMIRFPNFALTWVFPNIYYQTWCACTRGFPPFFCVLFLSSNLFGPNILLQKGKCMFHKKRKKKKKKPPLPTTLRQLINLKLSSLCTIKNRLASFNVYYDYYYSKTPPHSVLSKMSTIRDIFLASNFHSNPLKLLY